MGGDFDMGQRWAAALAVAPGAARELRFGRGGAKVAIFTPND
jgi:hypothetical protein